MVSVKGICKALGRFFFVFFMVRGVEFVCFWRYFEGGVIFLGGGVWAGQALYRTICQLLDKEIYTLLRETFPGAWY